MRDLVREDQRRMWLRMRMQLQGMPECKLGLIPMGIRATDAHSYRAWIDADPVRMEYDMITKLMRIVTAGAMGVAILGQAAVAQGFDNKKFFNEMTSRGVSTGTLDADKFFEEMRATGASSQNRLDPEKFFQELQARGASTPVGFDSRRFFDELAATGAKAPDIVKTDK